MAIANIVCRSGVGPASAIQFFVTHGLDIGAAIIPSAGGHFIPLTKKQQQEADKRARKQRKATESASAARGINADHIAAEMREAMHPTLKPLIMASEPDDDDEDIEFLLLNS